TCRICFEDKPFPDFPSTLKRMTKNSRGALGLPPACQVHLGVKSQLGPVCKGCIAATLTAHIEMRGPERTGCFECNATWDVTFIARYVTPDVSAVYNEMLLKVMLARDTHFMWCLNDKCPSGGIADNSRDGYPQVECAECEMRSCANCMVEWHKGMTCQEYQMTTMDELPDHEKRALRRLVKVGARRCPRCQMAVEKNGGCPNMYC
ncbi:hypothetical protein NA57DRAFT_26462, partial [Rhizodiscina lignyota]